MSSISACTVLLVEDDLPLRDVLQDILEGDGFDVIPAQHGRQALQYLFTPGGPAPDAVILDLMMPMVSGWQVLSAIRDDPSLRGLPMVVISAANCDAPDGATEYLRKPFSIRDLIEAVQQHVGPRSP